MKFLKNNFLIILFIIIFTIQCFNIWQEKYNLHQKGYEYASEIQKECLETMDTLTDVGEIARCERFLAEDFFDNYQKEYNFFDNFTAISNGIWSLKDLLVYFFIAISLIGVTRIFKDKVALYMLERENYSKFLKKLFCKSYRYIWFYPLLAIIMFLFSLYKASLDPTRPLYAFGEHFGSFIINHPYIFMILFIINTIIFSSICLNIALVIVRRQHNYFLALIEIILVILAIQLFLELVVIKFIFNNLLYEFEKVNLLGHFFNFLNMPDFYIGINSNVVMFFLVNLIYLLISFVCVYFSYRNKEKLVIDCEKNK